MTRILTFPFEMEESIVYLYHPESDCLFTMGKDEYIDFCLTGGIDSELCVEFSKEEYEQMKKKLGI